MAARNTVASEKERGTLHESSPTASTKSMGNDASWNALDVPLWCENAAENMSVRQPLTWGIPLPRGRVFEPCEASLHIGAEESTNKKVGRLVQCQPLAWWADGSVRWLLIDVLSPTVQPGRSNGTLRLLPGGDRGTSSQGNTAGEMPGQQYVVEVSGLSAAMCGDGTTPLLFSTTAGEERLSASLLLTDTHGQAHAVPFNSVEIETSGPVRTTIVAEGTLPPAVGLNCRLRVSFFTGSPFVKLQVTLHNPRRAHHEGGLWDLGDPNSVQLQSWVLKFAFPPGEKSLEECHIAWQAESAEPIHNSGGDVFIYQDSSGGENWRSPVHMNRSGRVPCQFRGYRVKHGNATTTGLRATPTVAVRRGPLGLVAAAPQFWQQFPLSLHANGAGIEIGLFSSKWSDRFELQGGEQKTHAVWLELDSQLPDEESDLPKLVQHMAAVAHAPLAVGCSPAWYESANAMSCFTAADAGGMTSTCQSMLEAALVGEQSFEAKREKIDEYGWRNYGDVWADHEQPAYKGPGLVISHYNNQFDMLAGGLRQFMRSGNPGWWSFAAPLAKHVIDIDVYRTSRDRAAYNGGLFWFTDHFHSAATSTHRTYSRQNAPQQEGRRERMDYGGGPGSEHNFATGLLYYYWMTGEPQAAEAVRMLAEWVIAMDDGRRNVLGLLDDGPTGLASMSNRLDYQGPGRGAANSMQVLLDAWLLAREKKYLAKCEEILRRVIHPADDVASLDLLDAEHHWSYTMFLSAVARYLEIKAEIDAEDIAAAYARASLLNYACWMAENERPYLDHPEQLEFPTETWAAQDLRKANVLRLAASHAADPEVAGTLRRRGDELADRAWRDLESFPTRQTTRAVAIVMTEGAIDDYLRANRDDSIPAMSPAKYDFGRPVNFVPQKVRIRNSLRSPWGVLKLMLAALRPKAWARLAMLYKNHRA